MSEIEKTGVLGVEKRANGCAIVWFDDPAEAMNTLKGDIAEDFEWAFGKVEKDPDVKAVVFASGKPDSFVAGANIDMLNACKTAQDAANLSRLSQKMQEAMASFPKPIVAAIHGVALGGGLEITLPCHGRIASDDSKTKLGLPECQLGLLPGGGGTQRLHPLIGVAAALDMLLTGKPVSAKTAKKMGLVDEVVPAPILIDAAMKMALALAAKGPGATSPKHKPASTSDRLREFALEENKLGRRVLFDQARKKVLGQTQGNYPAQEKILDVVRVGVEKGLAAGLEAEAVAFGELVVSPVAKQLISIFFAQTALKKDSGVDDPSVKPKKVAKVGMLGAGLMGAGITYVTINNVGVAVRLKDKDDAGLGKGLAYVRGILDGRVRKRRLSPMARDLLIHRVTTTTDMSGFQDVDVVIEAVFEDLGLKKKVLADVEGAGKEDVIFASNTSSLPITQIAEGAKRPENVIGMHYFSPVEKMPLLEIINTRSTAPWVTATCVELGKKQGKTVIVVNDGVGFYTSRILGPYMNEAAYLLAEGVAVEAMDQALVKWGFPVGPITLLDEVGIDVAEKVGHIVHDAFGDRMKPPPGIEKLVADKRYGRKNKRGFYVYDGKTKGKKEVDTAVYALLGVTPGKVIAANEIAERCALQMVNEAALCFQEGILRSARDGDVGAIFGLGFPPFRGGPFRYVDAVGVGEVVKKLERLRDQHGPRFAPAELLVSMAKEGQTFHGENKVEPPKSAGAVGTADKPAKKAKKTA
ncbi:MAG: fatty acid oxidation complex subunit alpha FadJ [Polyangiaceae bacterium]|nr:fatty acid oxidation complex subunit alpha FadJ [Polyangiaceae bacterium]